MPGKGLRKIPYVSKNPAYDSFKCECGALLRLKSPSNIEEHRNTPTHKKILATCDTSLPSYEASVVRPSSASPVVASVPLPLPSSSNRGSFQFQLFG